MTVTVLNAQRDNLVNVARMKRVAQTAVRRLRIRARGKLLVTFIDARRMRALNKRFCRHDADTDVLSFRYDGESIVGEVLVSPQMAHRYARRHELSYEQELARYVIHGLLHWTGEDDTTPTQQQRMRHHEDRLLNQCAP